MNRAPPFEPAFRDGSGRIRSEGQRQLVALTLATSQADVAAALNVSKQSVSAYCAGVRRPSIELLAAIERRLGIPCIAWADAPLRRSRQLVDETVLPATPIIPMIESLKSPRTDAA